MHDAFSTDETFFVLVLALLYSLSASLHYTKNAILSCKKKDMAIYRTERFNFALVSCTDEHFRISRARLGGAILI
jgi:hypothetical protein